ncbi:hypothetical protein JW968_02710 [Candidatus Woesearchaeota archaeon]|nr:hypothetical protein [Candidatus Woesearchaeota archaeon]
MKYRCMACNYRFEWKREKKPERCPYCAKRAELKIEMSSADMVRDVDDIA